MSLPQWNADGLLPPLASGGHAATLAEIHERCVLDAPNQPHRELLFNACEVYVELWRDIIGAGTMLVNGGFVTAKARPPKDIDLVVIPTDWEATAAIPEQERWRIDGLLTVQDVIIGGRSPMYVSRIQPFGVIDSFLAPPARAEYWHDIWSSVKADDGTIIDGVRKGYLEVQL